jgi:hypothetical protein
MGQCSATVALQFLASAHLRLDVALRFLAGAHLRLDVALRFLAGVHRRLDVALPFLQRRNVPLPNGCSATVSPENDEPPCSRAIEKQMKRYVPPPLFQRATDVATAISPKGIHDQMMGYRLVRRL